MTSFNFFSNLSVAPFFSIFSSSFFGINLPHLKTKVLKTYNYDHYIKNCDRNIRMSSKNLRTSSRDLHMFYFKTKKKTKKKIITLNNEFYIYKKSK